MLSKKRRILVVDDEPDIASTLATIFRSRSYETATALSGEEAVEVASSFQPDCIVSDITMGAMNGVDAAIAILGMLPKCKVLLVSGTAYRDLLTDARAKGFNFEILQKPVPPPELLAEIERIFSHPTEQKLSAVAS